MTIKHTFVSPKADGNDSTVVRPSDWNADHEVGDSLTVERNTAVTDNSDLLVVKNHSEEAFPFAGICLDSNQSSGGGYVNFRQSGADRAQVLFDGATGQLRVSVGANAGTRAITVDEAGAVAFSTPVPVTSGGTGAATAADARTAFDVYSKAETAALITPPSFGGCFEFNEAGSALSLLLNSTWYRWITGQAGTVKGAPYLTWDNSAAPTGKRLVVGASGAGVYLVNCAYSAVSNIATDIDAAIYVNAARQDNLRTDQAFPSSALYQAGAITGLVTLAAGDTVSLWFNASQNTATLTLKHVNLTLLRVG